MRNSVSVEQIQDGLGRGGQDERCRLTRGAVKPNADKNDRHAELVSGSPLEQISQTCIENSSLAPRGRGVGRGGEGKKKGRNSIPPRLILFTQKVPVVRKGHQSPKHTA